MARDLNDAWGWIERLVRRVDRLYSGAMLENSSITNGRMRFIGGVLRVDSGGTVSIEGTLEVDGATTITGAFTLTATSVWTIEGDGTITGDVTVTGKWVQNGEWELNGNGKIKGNVEQTGTFHVKGPGKILVGEGASQIVIDGATGKITAGNLVIDPTLSGGAIVFANGAQIFTDASTIQVVKGNAVVQVSDSYARLQYGGAVFELNGSGLRASNGVIGSVAGTGLPQGTILRAADGYFKQSDGT